MRPSLALIEPEIAGNVGALLRTAACLDVAVHLVEPCGFAFSDRALRRAGMDYALTVALERHADRYAFVAAMRAAGRRMVLLTTTGESSLHATTFSAADVLMLGSEGHGAPIDVHDAATLRVRIPVAAGCRSLNVSVAGGMALAEALRQTVGFPA